MASQQYAYRAQKSLGLVNGLPSYEPVAGLAEGLSPELGTARNWVYSPDGKFWVCAFPSCIQVYDTESAKLVLTLLLPNVIELGVSPRGNFLSTWERPVKQEDGTPHKNHKIFSLSTGAELIAFPQKAQEGFDVQYTSNESHALRLSGADIQVYEPADWSKGFVDRLHVEGVTSFMLSPSEGEKAVVAVFIAEKKGFPASVKLYPLPSLAAGTITAQKTFFKADRVQMKWNSLGTQILFLSHTDVDKTNKSYYGETSLFVLSATTGEGSRVTLDKEGPIHDFAWSPNGREFGVVYGYMPAKTVLFDAKLRTLHDFGSAPHNYISFNPQGRLIILGGFGNLAGKIDIIDRRSLSKINSIDAPNTSVCLWSGDGCFIMGATLSPRLRVDNGIKIWHVMGRESEVVHVQMVEELYQVGWKPCPVTPPFPAAVPSAPEASAAGAEYNAARKGKRPEGEAGTPLKQAGAYRPPGARGLATPAIFKREDEGGLTPPVNGTATPPRGYSRSPAPPGSMGYHERQQGHTNGQANGRGRGRERAPGTPSPGPGQRKDQGQGQGRDKRDKKDKDRREKGGGGSNLPSPKEDAPPPPTSPPPETPVEDAEESAALDAKAKKIRNLSKKLKAIEELKEKAGRGEKLELTQLRKIEGEASLRSELVTLGVDV